MKIPKEIIDNTKDNKLVDFLNNILESKSKNKTNFDIATAFFNIRAFAMLKENLDGVKKFRLLLGKSPEIKNQKTLGNVLLEKVKNEVEGFELTKEKNNDVKEFIRFLKNKNIEVRLYENFLHGKAYIFDDLIVIGSSNFTASGLTRIGELNTWKQEAQAIYTKKEWFDKFWEQSTDFKEQLIKILENSRFGSKKYSPYEIYIKSLYELQKKDIKQSEPKEYGKGRPKTKVDLTKFQGDAISRIMTRMNKYGGCIVADSVGLGKTWIAKKILEKIGYYKRKNILVVCPAQLREMWRRELKSIDVNQNIISQENLASEDYLEKARSTLGGDFKDVELIVVDESHNFRNPLSNRWENFFTLTYDYITKRGKRPNILFLTATPINNTPWDLFWQIMLLVMMDRTAFIKENIPDLLLFFKEAKDHPSLLNDLLNEISIRRTRQYIVENYPKAYIKVKKPSGELTDQKVIFPERKLQNISYELEDTYKGMYKEISKTISDDLTMAYYQILKYRHEGLKTEAERLALGRMIGIGGIFRTILLKRLESSVEAFRKSVKNHIQFLKKLIEFLKLGKLLTKKTFYKYVLSTDEEIDISEIKEELEDFDIDNYDGKKLFEDINLDRKLLKKILKKVEKIEPEDDSKLNKLKNKLLELSKKGQIVLFTYYSDTLNYIYEEIINDSSFENLNIEAVSSSGLTSKNPKRREKIVGEFTDKKINILLSTEVLSEGRNLQSARFLINYDLHWNPTRMIQRAGRIDRIGSPYKKIYVYNFFPEDELEDLLRLVEILQSKIIKIDKSIGLDQSVLGEEIHPKVFGIIRRIKDEDQEVIAELEQEAFGGGEKFYQPLKSFLREKAIEDLESIPNGVYSGLKKNKLKGVFFYYKYGEDFNFWYLYDLNNEKLIKNKTQIIDFIEATPEEKRNIPDFFDKVYEINEIVLHDIEKSYKEIESKQEQDSKLKEYSRSRGTVFIKKMVDEIEIELQEYLMEFPSDTGIADLWEEVKNKLILIPQTKKRLQVLRKKWRKYKKSNGNWKNLINELDQFLEKKGIYENKKVQPYDKSKLKLITIDFIT